MNITGILIAAGIVAAVGVFVGLFLGIAGIAFKTEVNPQEEAVLAALEGLNETELKANLILCCMRGEGNDSDNEETLRLARK